MAGPAIAAPAPAAAPAAATAAMLAVCCPAPAEVIASRQCSSTVMS